MRRYEHLYCIVGAIPSAGVALGIGVDGMVNWSNPMLHFMLGWQYNRVSDYCKKRDWKLQNLTEPGRQPIGY
jgi:hypothetical protein